MTPSVVIIGGGPAGSAAGRLLASWGHSVLLIDRAEGHGDARSDQRLAESLPPTTGKLLAQIGVVDAVDRAGFYRSTGNTVWWGSEDCRVEMFGAGLGWQVARPVFDRVLLEEAAAAGVVVRSSATVRAVDVSPVNGVGVEIEYESDTRRHRVRADWVLDCSGRAGVVARRFRTPGTRTYALVGAWRTDAAWDVPDPTHTLVEAYDGGWAWSVPVSAALRHSGVMIDGPSPRAGTGSTGRDLADAYRSELAKAPAHARVFRSGELTAVWACDASTYSSSTFGGHRFVLVGDAASFIDPLSSHGVKKALASAWIAAIVVNTCLSDPARESHALDFFAAWERDVNTAHARQSAEFAVEAASRFSHRFWGERAAAARALTRNAEDAKDTKDAKDAKKTAFERIQSSDHIDFELDLDGKLTQHPVIRGREIVLDEALTLDSTPVRYADNVDLLALARLAGAHRQVPDLYDAYCRAIAPAPLPNVLGGLSLLVAAGVLRSRTLTPC